MEEGQVPVGEPGAGGGAPKRVAIIAEKTQAAHMEGLF